MFIATSLAAQPPTDIYLGALVAEDGRLQLGPLRNVTDRDGYDNQPHFTTDGGGLLYTSIRDGQADTYRYDIASRSAARLTRTAESEYSPTVMPDGSGFSVVRVEADSAQRLWRFNLAGEAPGLLLPDVEPVGYHAWLDERTVALFVLGDPPTLQLATLGGQAAETIDSSIGRSLQRIPERAAISYVHQPSAEERWIVAFDVATRQRSRLARALPDAQDFAWTPSGTLLMGSGAKLYSHHANGEGEWTEIADLTTAGISGITRLAVSPDKRRIAIVAARTQAP